MLRLWSTSWDPYFFDAPRTTRAGRRTLYATVSTALFDLTMGMLAISNQPCINLYIILDLTTQTKKNNFEMVPCMHPSVNHFVIIVVHIDRIPDSRFCTNHPFVFHLKMIVLQNSQKTHRSSEQYLTRSFQKKCTECLLMSCHITQEYSKLDTSILVSRSGIADLRHT